MKKIICLAAAIALSSLCLSAQSLVGTWDTARTEIDGYSMNSTIVYNENGTFTRDHFMIEPDGDSTVVKNIYHDEGKWKLIFNGRRVFMKIKPSSVDITTGEGVVGGIGKAVEVFSKVDAFTSAFALAIVKLTDTELVLLEVSEDEDGDPRSEKIYYTRRQE